MKLNVTKRDGTVNFVINTDYITYPLIFVLMFTLSFFTVWTLIIPAGFYDTALSVLIAMKATKFISTRRKRNTVHKEN